MSVLRTTWVTLGLVALNLAVYVLTVATDPAHRLQFTVPELIQWGGITGPALRAGQWWRLFTAMFVHASPDHIAWNMISLYVLGRFLEARYAPARFLSIYLVCGLVSSVASAAWYWNTNVVQVGASGAISALVGAGAVSAWHMGEVGRQFRNRMLVWGLVIVVNGFLYSANNVAHLSGLLAGAAVVAAFGRRGHAALTSRETGEASFEDTAVVICRRCEAANPAGSRFCGRCGAPFGAEPAATA